ncbi:Uncharacterised protein [Mycobacterium tuberculosis]|nr:Uncharacterised protein [Mycobacterium tuberculosis]
MIGSIIRPSEPAPKIIIAIGRPAASDFFEPQN